MIRILLALVLVAVAPALLANSREVRERLEAMMDTDQLYRNQMSGLAPGSPESEALWEKQRQNDAQNIVELERIVERYGWPKRSSVGPKASMAAFLIVQHADLEYQKKYLPLVREAVAAGEAESSWLALLEDRILMREGREQIYGSQLVPDENGVLRLWPIEEADKVDERRAAVGLEPLADYLKRFGIEYEKPTSKPPQVTHASVRRLISRK